MALTIERKITLNDGHSIPQLGLGVWQIRAGAACEAAVLAAKTALQVHGAIGYSRHKPFEHIYRHHRRYRITEGAEEIQIRRIAGYMFGYMKQQAPKGVRED